MKALPLCWSCQESFLSPNLDWAIQPRLNLNLWDLLVLLA